MARKPRSQPFRLQAPWNNVQVEHADQMFQELYDDVRNGAINIIFSGGTLSETANGLTFSNANNVSFGLNASTVLTASVNTSLTNINLSAGTTSQNLSHLVFSNSNNVSFGLNGSTVTASASAAQQSINVSAGTTSNNLSNLVFSNANNVTFGLNGSTITASASGAGGGGSGGTTLSLFENIPMGLATQTVGQGTSAINLQPMTLPQTLSGSYLRQIFSHARVDVTASGTSINTTFTLATSQSHAWVCYTRGTGGSSDSLYSIASDSAASHQQAIFANGTDGSVYSITFNLTYPIFGGTSLSSTTYVSSSSGYIVSLSDYTAFFSGARFIDLPFNTALSPGNYWFGFGSSSQSTNSGGPSQITSGSSGFGASRCGVTCITAVPRPAGIHSTVNTIGLVPGAVNYTMTTAAMTSDSLALSLCLTRASNLQLYYQFLRVG